MLFFVCLGLGCRKRRYIANLHGGGGGGDGPIIHLAVNYVPNWENILRGAQTLLWCVYFLYELFLCQEKRTPFWQSHILCAEIYISYPQRVTLSLLWVYRNSWHLQAARTSLWYIYSSCYDHPQIASINLSYCYHIFRGRVSEMFVTYIYYVTYCIIHSGKTGILFSSLLCSLWWVQIVGYVMACLWYSFVCTLRHLIIIIVQTYL